MRRVAPAFALFFLSPLVAEFLLGDFTLTYLVGLLFLGPMYGGGALLIREVTRRTGRGWPTILTLAFVYGLIEEAVLDQSLFNPDYAGAHLLDRGFVPALGIAFPWTIFVLTLHVVWSISVPIALVESLVPARRHTPWLKTPGLVVTAVLYVLGALLVTYGSYTNGHYFAPWPKIAVAGLIVVIATVVAFRLPGTRPVATGGVPAWWIVGLAGLVAGSLFMVAMRFPVWLAVTVMLVEFAVVIVAVLRLSRRPGWTTTHEVALAGGVMLTYAWHAFTMDPLSGTLALPSHIVLAVLAVALVALGVKRTLAERPAA
jgi:hypothetical protein